MNVTCPSCATPYPPEARAAGLPLRCPTCQSAAAGPEAETRPNPSREPARAAVVRRGAAREHRDLFATRPVDMGSVKETLPRKPESHRSGMAARNETSVLFTVEALRGNSPVGGETHATTLGGLGPSSLGPPLVATGQPTPPGLVIPDEEGIIDLNALASAPATVGSRTVAPLFASEPPPAAFAADVDDATGRGFAMPGGFRLRKRAIAGIAAAAVALVLCSIGLSAAFKGEEPVARMATTMIAAPPPVAANAAAPEAVPTPLPAPPATAVATDDDDKAPGASARKARRGKGSVKASFVTTKVQSSGVPISGTGVAKTVPKASDKCGCKGDFNCILRCTATGK